MRLSDLASGHTLVLGFGREGRALEGALRTRAIDARVSVYCDRTPDPLPAHWSLLSGSIEALPFVPDRVLRSPGFPVDRAPLPAWRARGIEVTCISSLWFGERPDARVVAVTGSKGKSTTASLIAHLLRAGGLEAALGGNIGVPMLDLLDTRADVFVIELSSYQLSDLDGHVDVGVITRLFPEHLDWHGGAEAYYAAKLRLAALRRGGPLFINAADPLLRAAVDGFSDVKFTNREDCLQAAADGVYEHGRLRLAAARSPLPGRHNLDNLALAAAVSEAVLDCQLDLDAALQGFHPLPHRLERLKMDNGRVWINDSIATTPYATRAALDACADPIVLLLGGLERGQDWQPVIDGLRGRAPVTLVTLPDNGPVAAARLVEAGVVAADRVRPVETIEQAVAQAAECCPVGGTVLLSPGAPSFPQFKDFEDRGRRYARAVAALPARR
ncbi:MAG: UDP-N-acetylmuramoyl-L-alanine--D-glutamate ligase [Wenzhouxiangellaceae bacterium]|nr:UDP-N-acetylmuramoyl-L-alanine--D-glutamate ligase [Wenzhouxiangellaceae bacterium]